MNFKRFELIIFDLDGTLVNSAKDIKTWANAGPGAMRGLNRIFGRELDWKSSKHKWNDDMLTLFYWRHNFLPPEIATVMEMREIEHSLCEFDKYERVRLGQGTPRGRYK